MKNILTHFFCFIILTGNLIAQQSPCFFDEYTNGENLLKIERQIQDGVQNILVGNRNMDSIKAIPVVVHIIHNGGSENISEAQVQSQLKVLNEDFGKLPGTNGDGSGVDTEVRFFLANLDPDGRCTNGIVRVKSPLTNHQTYQRALLKELSFWDNTRYLNIYIVKNINGNVAGYSSFPGGPPEEDGVVVQHNYFGTTGTANSFLGRTGTHELGHWLGLYHTFNNSCGDDICTDGDFVCDTPPAFEPNYTCSTKNTCHNDMPDVSELKENYMDYTPGSCKNMLTEGQKMRIQSSLNEIRTYIWTDENMLSTGYDSVYTPPATCPVAADFVTLTRDICFGNSVYFMDISLNGASTWQWTFPGGNPAVSNEANPTVIYDSIGIYDVTLIASDGTSTDTLTIASYINVGSPGTGDALPYSENFDEGLYPPVGITINNPNGGITWVLDSLASTSGMYSMRMDNYASVCCGTVDELILPNLDFTSVSPDSQLYMSFNWAYARSDPSFSDEMIVLLSTDCGTTFTQVYYKSGNSLTTGPTQTTPFIPDSSQWKSAFIVLDNYKSETFVEVKIANVTDGGNNLYVDDLYIGNGSDLVSAGEVFLENGNLEIYPNPAFDKINVKLHLTEKEMLSVKLFNAQGMLLEKISNREYTAGQQQIYLPTDGIPSGVYFVVLEAGGHRKAVKVLVQK
ncbi:MAG TPA: T9SS type A sorting domain-containing protein [Bacteroidetes bacterium]|nr:T9SS type A sorting domain-containing protein [Bacteroidota bacterium]